MRLAEVRKERGVTQAELAEMVGVEQPTISRLERGSLSVTLKVTADVAKALDVSLAELFMNELQADELELLQAFRKLSPERQKGWLDMARYVCQD